MSEVFYQDLWTVILRFYLTDRALTNTQKKGRFESRQKKFRFRDWSTARSVCRQWRELADVYFRFEEDHFERNLKAGNVEAVQFLISKKGTPDPGGLSPSGIYPITEALSNPCPRFKLMVKALMKDERVDPSVMNNCAVERALFHFDEELVSMILDHPNVSFYSNMPFEQLAQKGSLDLIKKCLNHKTASNLRDTAGYIPLLHSSVQQNRLDVVQLFMEDSTVNFSYYNQIYLSSCVTVEMLELLLMVPGSDPSQCDILSSSCANGRLEMVDRLLMDPRISPEPHINAALVVASSTGQAEVVRRLLMDPRADPSLDHNQPFYISVSRQHYQVSIALLEDPRVHPSPSQFADALAKATSNGNIEFVSALLNDSRVDPSVGQNRAIYNAVSSSNDMLVALLLADERVDPSGCFIDAVKGGNLEIVSMLLADPRVDPSESDNEALKHAYIEGLDDIMVMIMGHPKVDSSFLFSE